MNQNEQDPMPLGDLPKYLQEQRENGTQGPAPVVGMGNIVVPQKKKSWLPFAAIMTVALGAGAIIAYEKTTTQEFTVTVHSDDGIKSIPTIMADGGADIISLDQISDTGYKVKVNTRKNKRSFLDWLRKNKNIKKVEE